MQQIQPRRSNAALVNLKYSQGDSGGPLILKGNSSEEDILVGTVSWADGCADPRFPDVYSRISYFASWIVEQVCELSPDDAPEYMGCNATIGVP